MWLAVNDRILTNVERTRRHIGDSDLCSTCGMEREMVLHVLRDCMYARWVWNRMMRGTTFDRFFNIGLEE